ncbi:CinA family protein, partial [Micrococcus luteus]|uniref:CinA family protein n=1 Tax=Micrococcus luteus TaxID=1270 RepID=UPI0031FDCE7C
ARAALGADVGVATTGVAGPEPHQGQPVGTVWLGLAVPDADANVLDVLGGERDARPPRSSSGSTATAPRSGRPPSPRRCRP